jgi:hypothetical protein
LEYGGTELERGNFYMDRAWLSKHGCLQGKLAEDWVDEELTASDLRPFAVPTEEELRASGIQSIFLGQFLKWDPVQNAEISKGLGFQVRPEGPVMGIWDFADLDCKLIVAHHYPKWLKFGMTRTFDNVSVEIRNGRMSRERAIELIRKNKDDRPPAEHMESLCRFIGISEEEFYEILERHRNLDIWKKNAAGEWYIPGYLAA